MSIAVDMAFFGKRDDSVISPLMQREKKPFKLHMLSAISGGIAISVALSHEYIAVNGLNAAVWQITLLTMLWPMSNLLSVFINHWMDRTGNYSLIILLVGVFFRLPLGLMYFSSDVNLMMVLLLFYFAANSVMIPGQNTIMKRRYGDNNRARLFGWFSSVLTLASLPTALIVGALLDADFQVYRILFVAEGIFGAGQAVFLSLMGRGSDAKNNAHGKKSAHFLKSLWRVFHKDREFVYFEVLFFLYGTAFLMILPVIPFFAMDVLKLSYEQYAFAKGVIAQLGVLFLSPFLGIKLDKLHPFRFTGIICLILAFYPLTLAVAGLFPGSGKILFYLAFLVFALGMAGIRMSWSMSSIYFAPEGAEATYQGFHVTLTGVRGLFAPVLGSLILHYFGFTQAFLTSAGIFVIAGILFLRKYREKENREHGNTFPAGY